MPESSPTVANAEGSLARALGGWSESDLRSLWSGDPIQSAGFALRAIAECWGPAVQDSGALAERFGCAEPAWRFALCRMPRLEAQMALRGGSCLDNSGCAPEFEAERLALMQLRVLRLTRRCEASLSVADPRCSSLERFAPGEPEDYPELGFSLVALTRAQRAAAQSDPRLTAIFKALDPARLSQPARCAFAAPFAGPLSGFAVSFALCAWDAPEWGLALAALVFALTPLWAKLHRVARLWSANRVCQRVEDALGVSPELWEEQKKRALKTVLDAIASEGAPNALPAHDEARWRDLSFDQQRAVSQRRRAAATAGALGGAGLLAPAQAKQERAILEGALRPGDAQSAMVKSERSKRL